MEKIFLGSFIETTKEFKKLDEVDDAEEMIKIKINSFESWPTIVFIRGSDKRKYRELIRDLSIQYVIKNSQYPNALWEAVDVMCKLNLNQKRIMIKATHKNRIKM